MIFPLGGLLLGALLGGLQAKRKGGKPADIAQYATVAGILLGLIGLFILVIFDRSLLS
jgi:hypothetical protein